MFTVESRDKKRAAAADRENKTALRHEQKEPLGESALAQMADAVPTKPSGKRAEEPVSKIGGWLTAISLAAVLAGAGFIARFSREQFLGISLGDWNAQDLSLLADDVELTACCFLWSCCSATWERWPYVL